MFTLYYVTYNDETRVKFADVSTQDELDAVHAVFDYNPRYYRVVKTEKVSTRINFISSYSGVTDFEYYRDGTWHRFEYQYNRESCFDGSGYKKWNYPNEETFERKYNGRLFHTWQHGCEPIPADVFDIFKKMRPNAINGYPPALYAEIQDYIASLDI